VAGVAFAMRQRDLRIQRELRRRRPRLRGRTLSWKYRCRRHDPAHHQKGRV